MLCLCNHAAEAYPVHGNRWTQQTRRRPVRGETGPALGYWQGTEEPKYETEQWRDHVLADQLVSIFCADTVVTSLSSSISLILNMSSSPTTTRRKSTSSGTLHRRPSLSPTRSRRDAPSPTQPYHALPRPERPSNPPEPPLTLLHPTTSRSIPPPDRQDSADDEEDSSDPSSPGTKRRQGAALGKGRSSWMPFAGMIRDVKARAPWYISDWTDAWNYRVIPSTWVS